MIVKGAKWQEKNPNNNRGVLHFAWKSEKKKKNQTSKTEDGRGLRLFNIFAELRIWKWLLTQTMSLLLHQTKQVFKGNLSLPYLTGPRQLLQRRRHHLFCLHRSRSFAMYFLTLKFFFFPPHNIFTPTYRCNWRRNSYKTLLLCGAPNRISACHFYPGRKEKKKRFGDIHILWHMKASNV